MNRRQLIRAALLMPVAHAVTGAAPKADVFDRAAIDRMVGTLVAENAHAVDGLYWFAVHPDNFEWLEVVGE